MKAALIVEGDADVITAMMQLAMESGILHEFRNMDGAALEPPKPRRKIQQRPQPFEHGDMVQVIKANTEYGLGGKHGTLGRVLACVKDGPGWHAKVRLDDGTEVDAGSTCFKKVTV